MDEKRKLAAEITRDIIVAIAGKIICVNRETTINGKKFTVYDCSPELCRHWDEVFKTVYNSLNG